MRLPICLLTTLFSGAFLLAATPIVRAQVPRTINFQGMLLDESGSPRDDGNYELTITLFDQAEDGAALWTETHSVLTTNGVFSVVLGDQAPLDLDFDRTYWLGTTVDDEPELADRIPLATSPYSLRAAAVAPGGVEKTGGEDGQVLMLDNGVAGWNELPAGEAGDITSVQAGAGLSGGGETGDVELTLDTGFTDDRYLNSGQPNAVVSGMIAPNAVAPGDINTSGASNNQVLTVVAGDAAWADAPDGGGGDAWSLTGDAGTTNSNFVGTTDNRPLEIRVNGSRALRIEPTSGSTVNMIGGYFGNTVGGNVRGVTISGGGENNSVNEASAVFSTISGGAGNKASGLFATVGGGASNVASGEKATVGGGESNSSGHFGVVGGGSYNEAGGLFATVGGGSGNEAGGDYGTVPGGDNNSANGAYSFAAGRGARAIHAGTFVWSHDVPSTFSSTAGRQFLIQAAGGVGIGTNSPRTGAQLDVAGPIYAGGTTLLFRGTSVSGSGGLDDGVRIRYDNDFGGAGKDYLLFEKTDGNQNAPDGGIAFVGTGADGVTETALQIFGTGSVSIPGNLSKGSGSFKIDHPLDPQNKYLYHSFVESPDMMNVYNGNVVLDNNGEASIALPDYFEALNRDFRYQLTCIGSFAPVFIAEKISGNRFRIAGGEPGMEVSWQVTGVRKDPFAAQNPIEVEVEKPLEERGTYLHPSAYGASN